MAYIYRGGLKSHLVALGPLWLVRGLDLCWKALRLLHCPAPLHLVPLSTLTTGRLRHYLHRKAFIKPEVLYNY